MYRQLPLTWKFVFLLLSAAMLNAPAIAVAQDDDEMADRRGQCAYETADDGLSVPL